MDSAVKCTPPPKKKKIVIIDSANLPYFNNYKKHRCYNVIHFFSIMCWFLTLNFGGYVKGLEPEALEWCGWCLKSTRFSTVDGLNGQKEVREGWVVGMGEDEVTHWGMKWWNPDPKKHPMGLVYFISYTYIYDYLPIYHIGWSF